jgi:hypothetical protein
VRFRIEPHDIPLDMAARRLGMPLDDFNRTLPGLVGRGFPQPDPDTGNYDLHAIDRWCDSRNLHLFGETAKLQARDASTVAKDRIEQMKGAKRG